MAKRKKILAEKQRKKQQLDSEISAPWHSLDPETVDLDEYELELRQFKDDIHGENEGLPIVVGGYPKRVIREDPQEDKQDESQEPQLEPPQPQQPPQPQLSLIEVQERVAAYATLISEDPESHVSKLKELQEMASTATKAKTRQVLVLSLLAIYKPLIPLYRIQPLTEAQQKEKVTKDVRKLREYEQRFLTVYTSFLSLLTHFYHQGKSDSEGPKYKVGCACLKVACELFTDAPHFNNRQTIIHLLVEKLSSQRVDASFLQVIECIQTVFRNDSVGTVSFEVVEQLAKMIRLRRYKVDSRVLHTLLSLRLLTELEGRGDLERMLKNKPQQVLVKKKQRVHLTKTQRKNLKEQREIDEEMRKAETAVDVKVREKFQARTLKIVFSIYFNIIKERSRTLLGAALEGLAKYAHLINMDLFGDLVEVLREVITTSINGDHDTRRALLCICTVFALLSSQAPESAKVDLTFFINHLYSILLQMSLDPEIERSHKHLLSSHRGKLANETDMLVQALEALFTKRTRATKPRVLAFTKRLALCAQYFPERTALLSLDVLHQMMSSHPEAKALLSTEDRVERGRYNMASDVPEQTNAQVATLWELSLLRKHFSPNVADLARRLTEMRE